MKRLLRPGDPHTLALALGIKLLLVGFAVSQAEARLDRSVRTEAAFFEIWDRWDALHYLAIASRGYGAPPESVSLGFPPLFPLLVRAAGALTGSIPRGGLACASLASLALALVLQRLYALDLPESAARRAVLLLLVYPTSVFLHVTYSEGMFLLLVAATFLAARQDRWGLVAPLSALCGLTRLNAFLLAPALLVEAWPRRDGRWRRILASLGVGVGSAGYLWLNWQVAGSPFRFLEIHGQLSGRSLAFPWQGAAEALRLAQQGGSRSIMVGVMELGFAAIGLLATLLAARRLRPAYAVWMAGNWLLITAQGFWLSIPRLSLALFPGLLLAARLGETAGTLWLVGSTLLLGLFTAQYVQGWWAS